jgi:hypothetical protein
MIIIINKRGARGGGQEFNCIQAANSSKLMAKTRINLDPVGITGQERISSQLSIITKNDRKSAPIRPEIKRPNSKIAVVATGNIHRGIT